jgi:hypothetical protein
MGVKRFRWPFPGLLKPTGWPPIPPPIVDVDSRLILAHKLRDFLFDHPGCVSGSSVRRQYSHRFHLFVLDLCEANLQCPLESMAETTGVPLGTLKDWLRGERPQVDAPENLATTPEPGVARIETVIAEYKTWDGGFQAFFANAQSVGDGTELVVQLAGQTFRVNLELLATSDVIREEDPGELRPLLRLAARRIHSTFAVPHEERLAATRFLFAKVLPVD